jgi:ribonuclease P protein component
VTGSLRFPRSARLLAKADFDAAFAHGKRIGGAFLRAHVQLTPGLPARLGCALAKRSIPLASDRNRVRRQIREQFRLRRAQLDGRSIVFAARNEARSAPLPALRVDIERLLERAAALNPTHPNGTMSG